MATLPLTEGTAVQSRLLVRYETIVTPCGLDFFAGVTPASCITGSDREMQVERSNVISLGDWEMTVHRDLSVGAASPVQTRVSERARGRHTFSNEKRRIISPRS
jgi:hypothetical protein